jgi:hypothetical protein
MKFLLTGYKLGAKPLTMATAAVTYHRFFAEAAEDSYDCYVRMKYPNFYLFA